MLRFYFALCFTFINVFSFGQTKIVVKNKITNEVIPYAKFNFKDGTCLNTELDGSIVLPENKTVLNVSAVGFEDLVISSDKTEYYLIPMKFTDIDEVKILKPKFSREYIIDPLVKKKGTGFSAGKTSWVLAKKFEYKDNLPENLFLKKIRFLTSNSVGSNKPSKILVKFYKNDDGKAGDLYRVGGIVAGCKAGLSINEIDLSKYQMKFPKEGLFIGFEWILNDENKNSKDKGENASYGPTIVGLKDGEDNLWHIDKDATINLSASGLVRGVNGIALELILTD